MDPSYYDEFEHLDIHCNISTPSGRVMWRPLESWFGPLLRTALLSNISLWKIKNRGIEMWRTQRSIGERKREEGDPSIWKRHDKVGSRWIHHTAGMSCTDTNFGPKLWVMNISCDKWENRNSWGVVEDTFACQQTAVTPPGVWRGRNVPGKRACPHKSESPLALSTEPR